jgi:16S rRNA (uracil1498-N3)-methyltransferase
LTLIQALPKGKVIEEIIQKATELGVARIVPLLSERVVAHLDDSKLTRRGEQWRLVAIEAIKQCGSAWLPVLDAPQTLQAFLARRDPFDLSLIASLRPGGHHPREYFDAFRAHHRRPPDSVALWVGPEGDFSEREVIEIQAAGARPITLGRLVLRSETAAVYGLSVLSYELASPPSGRISISV